MNKDCLPTGASFYFSFFERERERELGSYQDGPIISPHWNKMMNKIFTQITIQSFSVIEYRMRCSDKRASARPLVWRHQSGGEFGWEEGHIDEGF